MIELSNFGDLEVFNDGVNLGFSLRENKLMNGGRVWFWEWMSQAWKSKIVSAVDNFFLGVSTSFSYNVKDR